MFQSTSPVLSFLPTLFFSSFIAAPLLSSFQPTRFPQARRLCLSLASQPSSFHLWILPLLIFIFTSPLLPSFTFPPLLLILSLSSLSYPSRLQQSLSSPSHPLFSPHPRLYFHPHLRPRPLPSPFSFLYHLLSISSSHPVPSFSPSISPCSLLFFLTQSVLLSSLSHPLLLPHLHPLPCPCPFSLLPLPSLSHLSPLLLVLSSPLPHPPPPFLLVSSSLLHPPPPRVPAEEQSVSRLFLCA